MFVNKNKLVSTITYASGASGYINLPRDSFYRRLRLRVTGTATTSATGFATLDQLFTNLSVKSYGTQANITYYALPSKALTEFNKRDYGQALPVTALTGSMSADAVEYEVWIDFAMQPRNNADVSAVIPAHKMNNWTLEYTFNAATTLGGVAGAFTLTVEILADTLKSVSPSEEAAIIKGLRQINIAAESKTLTASVTNFTQEYEIVTGRWIKDILVNTVVSGADSNTGVTDWVLKQLAPEDRDLMKTTWLFEVSEDKVFNNFSTKSTGWVLYDPIISMGGLNTIGLKQGDIKFLFNTGASAPTINVYTRSFM